MAIITERQKPGRCFLCKQFLIDPDLLQTLYPVLSVMDWERLSNGTSVMPFYCWKHWMNIVVLIGVEIIETCCQD